MFYVDLNWIYISILLFLLFLFVFFLSLFLKPNFLVPFSKIILPRYFFEKLIIFTWLFIILLLPLNISLKWDRIEKIENIANVQILFDVSLSMVADDIYPSRFEATKNALYELVEWLDWYNVWIIIYSWLPFNWIPFSNETSAILSKIKNFNLSEFPPTIDFVGTAIWDAIYLWIDNLFRLYWDTRNPWVILLLTDWDTNKWSDPFQAAEYAKNLWIKIYWVWIWQEDQIVWVDTFGSPVMATFNYSILNDIIETNGWISYHVLTNNDFIRAFEEIKNDIVKNEVYWVELELIPLDVYLYFFLSLMLSILLLIKIYIFQFK